MPSQTAPPPSADDEITPIVSANRGSSRDYNTASATSPNLHAGKAGKAREERAQETVEPQAETQDVREGQNGQEGQGQESRAAREGGWSKRLKDIFGAVELDNKGSVARDHLALERTFLAWLRTSLSFASIGIAITQLFRLNTTISDHAGQAPVLGQSGTQRLKAMGKPLGATFLGISILVLLVGWRRYNESQRWIIKGKFPASRGSVIVVVGITGALIVTSLAVVLAVGKVQFEK